MAVRPAAGEVLVEKKFTSIESPEEKRGGRVHPPMWDFIDSLTPEQWASKEYEIRLYRGTSVERGAYCAKYFEPIDHERIKNDFGGGKYNIMMKVPPGSQLRYNENIEIVGPPKENPLLSTNGGSANDSALLVAVHALIEELRASRGGTVMQDGMRQMMAVGGQMLSSGAEAVKSAVLSVAPPAPTAPNPMSDPASMIRFLVEVKSLFAPSSTNSLQETLATLKLFKESGLVGGGSEGKLVDKLALGLVNQLPVLTQHVAGIMDGYRRAEEAKLNAAALNRGVPPPINVQPIPPPAPAPKSNVIAMPGLAGSTDAEAPAADGQASPEQLAQAEQMLQYIEQKIVELLANEQNTPEQAAISALTFIDVTDPVKAHPDGKNLIDQVLQYGEMGLRHIFSTRPILQQVQPGERLEAFMKAFLENGRRVSAPENLEPNPSKPPA